MYRSLITILSFSSLLVSTNLHALESSQAGYGPAAIQLVGAENNIFTRMKDFFSGKDKEDKSTKRSLSMHGMSKEEIREIQELLAQLGYEPGEADGLPGKLTRTAIREYQEAESLDVNGKPSSELLANIRFKVQPTPENAENVGQESNDKLTTISPLSSTRNTPRPQHRRKHISVSTSMHQQVRS